jgi:hypothetical protein
MAFYRVGEAFIEVVASGREPALIGLALKTPDLDATVAQIRLCGGPVSDPKPAVQGGRIASVWTNISNGAWQSWVSSTIATHWRVSFCAMPVCHRPRGSAAVAHGGRPPR